MINKIIERYNLGQDEYKTEITDGFYDNDPNRILIKKIDFIRTLSDYEFLVNPKYGWIDTFHSSKEWQAEFVKYMLDEYDNIAYVDNELQIIKAKRGVPVWVKLNKTMQVGFIIEFITAGINASEGT